MSFVRNDPNNPRRVSSRLASLVQTTMVAAALIVVGAGVSAAGPKRARLSSDLDTLLKSGANASVDVIVSGSPERVAVIAQRHHLRVKKALTSGAVFEVSRQTLDAMSSDSELDALSSDADVHSSSDITTEFTGAEAAWSGSVAALGAVNGAGIGVAIIDSGIANHPALAGRVAVNVDFTSPRGNGWDGYGHGTHVAGIVAAQSAKQAKKNPEGAQGMAPGAHLINLRVLDSNGSGKASDVIEAVDWAIKNKRKYSIRVLNMSLGSAPTQKVADDPLCQAVERAARAGLVVVVAAGNRGESADGKPVYGSITSPGTSPFAITVGAIRTQGTLDPADDVVAPWSSKGPTLVDHIVKPDLVAPGSKIVSTVSANSTLMKQNPDHLIDGPGANDYAAMTGTSMAAAVVSGAAALLLDGKPRLTPLEVKLALQASAAFIPQAGSSPVVRAG